MVKRVLLSESNHIIYPIMHLARN